MRTVQSESVDYPSLLDTNSSESTIYERSDIVPVEREGQTYYRYTEHQYSVSEWLKIRVPEMESRVAGYDAKIMEIEATLIKTDETAEELKTALISKDVIRESDLTVAKEK